MRYAINRSGRVNFEMGETPFPAGSVWPIPAEYLSTTMDQLKIVSGTVVLKSEEELRIQLLPEKYRTNGGLDADGNQVWVEKTQEEKDAIDQEEANAVINAELQRQANKSITLKTLENQFLTMCDLLTNTTSHAKLGFDELQSIVLSIPDAGLKIETGLKLLTLDAALKREGGLKWWDDCVWHSEIVE